MDNSVYITLSRQLALFRDMSVTANNLANVNTTGYNASHVMFSSYLEKDDVRGKMAFTQDISNYRSLEPGSLTTTNNTFDMAINGEGYFSIETPLGTRYTRSGNFQIDAEGTLVTPEGYQVLDNNGQQIQFTNEDKNVTIGGNGNITVDGEERAILGVVTFTNPQALQRAGDRMYVTEETPEPSANAVVVQGVLENSNVQPVLEMTHMIDVTRSVSSTAKFIEVMYELQRKTNSTWTQQS